MVEHSGARTLTKMEGFVESTREVAKSVTENGSFLAKFGNDVGNVMLALTKTTSSYGQEILQTSRQVGVGVEEWQKLTYAANTTNVEQTYLLEGMDALSKKMVEAAGGSKLTGQAFLDLGIDIKDTEGKLRTPNEIFKEISVVFADMEDSPAKAALAVQLFGESGDRLLPMLDLGKKGLEEMGAEAMRSATFLSEDACSACDAFDGSLGRLHTMMNSVVGKVAEWVVENPKLTSAIEYAAEGVQWFYTEIGSLLTEVGSLAKSFSDLVEGWYNVSEMVKGGIKGFKDLKNAVLRSDMAMSAYRRGSELAAGATRLFNQALKGNPIIRIVSLIIALGTAVYFVIKNWDKVKEFFSKLWDKVKEIFSKVCEWMKELFMKYVPYEMILKYWEAISNTFQNIWEKVKNVFAAVWDWIKNLLLNYTAIGLVIKHWDKIEPRFKAIWEKVKTSFLEAWEWIKGMFLDYTPLGLIIKHWDTISEKFGEIWEKVKTSFLGAWEWIKEMFLDYTPYGLIIKHWDTISEKFGEIWDKVKIAFDAAWQWIKDIFSFNYTPDQLIINNWDQISEFFGNLWEKVSTGCSKAWEGLKELFLNYTPHGLIIKNWDKISDKFGEIWEKVKVVFSDTWEWLKGLFLNYTPYGLIIKNWDTISDKFGEIWEKVKFVFSDAWEGLKNLFLNYTPYGLIITHWEEITTFFENMWEKVKEVFSQTWEQIATFFSGINPVEWISGMWEKVGEFFSDLKDRFFDWGKEIIRGLVDGVTAFARNAVESIANVGQKIAGKFKSLLGINSPSRLFMEYGVNITQGLTGGIHQGEGEVDRATQGLAESTTQKVKEALTETVQSQSESNSYVNGISNNIGGSNTEGGVSLVYSPTVNISGTVTEQSQQDFLKLLRSHKDEIIELMERHTQNKSRLSFA